MNALHRFLAILRADLRERTRTPRFWALLAAMVVLSWWCFPTAQDNYMVLSVQQDSRGAYSSAWVGMVLAMVNSLVLGLGGFYMVRGTLVRDFDTRVWQLLVATPMTRGGFLLAKWASHMLVLGIVVASGLAVGLVAQMVRGEDRAIDLFELLKPALVISLPGMAMTSMAAIWFDLLPWLRRTAGNILFFVLWVIALSAPLARLEHAGAAERAAWTSDPNGMVLVARDFQRVRSEQTGVPQEWGFSLGSPKPKQGAEIFQWKAWHLRPMDLLGRALWLGVAMFGVLLGAPLLDRAAARGGIAKQASRAGLRLRWLDPLLRPFAHGSFGVLAVAELKLVLRSRSRWWWLAALAVLGVQAFGSGKTLQVGTLLAWALPLDVLARGVLRERDQGTGAMIFSAPHMLGRLLSVRFATGFLLMLVLGLPSFFRLLAEGSMQALALLAMMASVVSWGMALGALCRNPRPFELLLVGCIYVGMQGASLLDPGATTTLPWHMLALLPAWALLAWAWPRMATR